MKMNLKSNWILRAAVAAVPMLGICSLAAAQFPAGNDGRALDANKRVGSGGNNDDNIRRNTGPSSDDIVYGNVTGGKAFRGRINSFDPTEFRGRVGGSRTDRFIRDSVGAPTPNAPNEAAWNSRPYYGDARGVNAPVGAVSTGIGTGGTVLLDRPRGNAIFYNTTAQPAQMVVPTTAGDNEQQYLMASPITGVRPLTTDSLQGVGSPYGATSAMDATIVNAMRAELNEAAGVKAPPPDAIPSPNLSPKPLDSSGEPNNKAIPNKPLDSAINPASPQGAGEGIRRNFTPPPPEQQSAQYAEMMKRYKQMQESGTLTDEQANRLYNEQKRLREASPAGAAPKPGQPAPNVIPPAPGGVKPVAPAPGAVTPPAKAPEPAKPGAAVKKPEPVKVQSLATGVNAKGFSNLLTQAEDLMKQGKFTSAIDQYDAAEQVSPNNPLVKIGRANAELGAAYYLQAEQHLRDAFKSNPALLTAQYDLKRFYGEDRLAFLQKDLKDIANADQKQDRPAFLLAYILYNSGEEAKAESYLDLADKRSGSKDPFYKTLREAWTLPAENKDSKAGTTQPANK